MKHPRPTGICMFEEKLKFHIGDIMYALAFVILLLLFCTGEIIVPETWTNLDFFVLSGVKASLLTRERMTSFMLIACSLCTRTSKHS